MKRLILAMAAVASIATPLPAGPAAWAQGRERGAERQERRPDRARDEERRAARRFQDERPRDTRPSFGYERRERDERRGARWDDDEPPRAPAGRGYGEPAARNERQRGFAPRAYQGPVVEDFRRYRLRPPPQGYAWVRLGDGFALISLDDGQIFDRVR